MNNETPTPITVINEESMSALVELINNLSEAFKQFAEELVKLWKEASARLCYVLGYATASDLLHEIELYKCAMEHNSKYWHLYKYARKKRTRKKYRKMLETQLRQNR